jgi:hypothetical protein
VAVEGQGAAAVEGQGRAVGTQILPCKELNKRKKYVIIYQNTFYSFYRKYLAFRNYFETREP